MNAKCLQNLKNKNLKNKNQLQEIWELLKILGYMLHFLKSNLETFYSTDFTTLNKTIFIQKLGSYNLGIYNTRKNNKTLNTIKFKIK